MQKYSMIQKSMGSHSESLSRVLQLLKDSQKPISKSAVYRLAGMSFYQGCRSLGWLCDSGLVEKVTIDGHVLYRIVGGQHEQ